MSNNWGCSCGNSHMPCQSCHHNRDHKDDRHDELRDDRRDWNDNRHDDRRNDRRDVNDNRRDERRNDRHDWRDERGNDRCNWCNRNNNWPWR